jgi:hypothetical protein
MAKVELSELHTSVSGGIGRHVYRRKRGGGVTVARRGTRTAPPSEAQVGVQNRLRTAAAFARDVLAHSDLRVPYERVAEELGKSAYSAAVTDFFTAPVVHLIEVSNYHGAVGDKIKVLARDDVDVVAVSIVLKDASGAVLESGAATSVNASLIYAVTTVRPAGQPVTIEATAKDRPGNVSTLTKAITVA